MTPSSTHAESQTIVGITSTLVGIAGLILLAAYWITDPAALPKVLRVPTTSVDAETLAALAGTFRAAFDLFAAAVLALLLMRRAWSLLGSANLLTLLFIPVGDALIWWATIPDPAPADLAPHAILATPFLIAAIAFRTRGTQGEGEGAPHAGTPAG